MESPSGSLSSSTELIDPEKCEILAATSSDERFPAENMLDGSTKTFFATTGLYPQEISISLGEPCGIEKMIVSSCGIRVADVECAEDPDGLNTRKVCRLEGEATTGQLQNIVWTKQGGGDNTKFQTIRLIIAAGWDDFCSIHTISVLGSRPKKAK